MKEPLLRVRDLNVTFDSATGGGTPAVRNISFDVAAGEIVGIVGESGSGKSVSCRAVLGLLPESAMVSGQVEDNGKDLLSLDSEAVDDTNQFLLQISQREPGSQVELEIVRETESFLTYATLIQQPPL